jgi:hypothetical protein
VNPHLAQFVNATIKESDALVNSFIKKKCFPDLLATGYFPNIKEVTESAACVYAAYRHLGLDRSDPNVHVVVIGDGHQPRTGAMFAYTSRWRVTSVDPQMRNPGPDPQVKRLYCVRDRVQDVRFLSPVTQVAVLPHAHVTVADAMEACPGAAIVSLQCCIPHVHPDGRKPDVEFEERGCKAPERTIRIWRNP